MWRNNRAGSTNLGSQASQALKMPVVQYPKNQAVWIIAPKGLDWTSEGNQPHVSGTADSYRVCRISPYLSNCLGRSALSRTHWYELRVMSKP
ncbi:hypothetical protein N7451_001050 [Penicillium sp. IBT 35674x]|nr:hypothetical protein N7451_001050 [Penicillium sp. IBT 35674x]